MTLITFMALQLVPMCCWAVQDKAVEKQFYKSFLKVYRSSCQGWCNYVDD